MPKSIRVFFKFLWLLFWYMLASVVAAKAALLVASLPAAADSFSLHKHLLPVAVVELVAMVLLASSLRTGFLTSACLLSCFYHITKHTLMLIEAYFYLNLWNQPSLITGSQVIGLEVMGLVFSLLICPVVVLLFTPSCNKASNEKSAKLSFLSNRGVIRAYVFGALGYAAFYLLAGVLILIPLAGPHFSASYENLAVPAWMPLLQVARGSVWVGIIFWYLNNQSTEIKDRYDILKLSALVGIGLVIFGAAQLWVPTLMMPRELQVAHMVELSVSMFLFGVMVVCLWAKYAPIMRVDTQCN